MARLRARAGILFLALLVAATSQGCGSDDGREGPPSQPGNIDGPESMLISDRDIEGVGASTPYAAVLRWWQALQRGDVDQLRKMYVQPIPARAARRQIAGFRHRYSMPIDPQTRKKTTYTATVRTEVRTVVPFHDRPNVISVRDFPSKYFLALTLGGWKLRLDSYEHYTNGRKFSQLVVG